MAAGTAHPPSAGNLLQVRRRPGSGVPAVAIRGRAPVRIDPRRTAGCKI